MTSYDDCLKAIDEHGKRALGEDLQRPMTQLESQILYGLYSFATFCDFGRDVMARRNKRIKRATARLGLIKWACRSLYDDYIAQLTPEGYETFRKRAHNMQLSVVVRKVQTPEHDGWKLCRDADLEALASAAWHGECQYCAKTGMDARKCKLRKTLDGLQCIEPGSNSDCWYRAD